LGGDPPPGRAASPRATPKGPVRPCPAARRPGTKKKSALQTPCPPADRGPFPTVGGCPPAGNRQSEKPLDRLRRAPPTPLAPPAPAGRPPAPLPPPGPPGSPNLRTRGFRLSPENPRTEPPERKVSGPLAPGARRRKPERGRTRGEMDRFLPPPSPPGVGPRQSLKAVPRFGVGWGGPIAFPPGGATQQPIPLSGSPGITLKLWNSKGPPNGAHGPPVPPPPPFYCAGWAPGRKPIQNKAPKAVERPPTMTAPKHPVKLGAVWPFPPSGSLS